MIARPRWPSRQMPDLRAVSGRLCQVVDMVILSAAFLGVLILPIYFESKASLLEVIEREISVRGALVAVVCLATWCMILFSVGMYKPARTLWEYVLRCFIGLNCCAAVIGLIEQVLRPGFDVWHFIAIYWLICGVLMAVLRLVLFQVYRTRRPRLAPVDQR